MASVKFTVEQYRLLEQTASSCKMSLSAWMRSIVLQVASKPAKEGYHRVRTPNGALT